MSWDTIEPTIRKATEKYLIPEIGLEIYTSIAEEYNSASPTYGAGEEEFLTLCKDVLAYHTILYAGPELNIGITDLGMVEKAGGASSGVYPTTQWRYHEFRRDITKKADQLLDRLAAFLDDQIAAETNDTFFDLYKNSGAYTDTKTAFFRSADDFSKYVDIGKSRRLFTALRPYILKAEADVKTLICSDQFDTLSAKLKSDDLADVNLALYEKIAPWVACKSLSASVPGLILDVDSEGIRLSSFTDGMKTAKNAGGTNEIGAYLYELEKQAVNLWRDLAIFIHANIDDYPDIAASDCYSEYKEDSQPVIDTGQGGIML